MNRLIAKNLTAETPDRPLFKNLNFEAQSGDIWQIVGDNGSGKTTLLRLLAGLDVPTEGLITHSGNGQLCYLGHQSAVKANLTVAENLSTSFLNSDVTQLNNTLKQVKLHFYTNALAAELSAGQQRRIALARIQLSQSAIWIMDEPLTALDVSGQAIVAQMIKTQQQANGIIIFTSHQLVSFTDINVKELRLK